MDTNHERRAVELYLLALVLPPAERQAFLDHECAGDAALRDRVEDLLAADSAGKHQPASSPGIGAKEAPPPSESPLIEAAQRQAEQAPKPPAGPPDTARVPRRTTLQPGDVIGPYRILAELGVGGFGEVYLAEQREPIQRRVALKVIRPDRASEGVVARFEQERQALAVMDHPHVAKVLDAGTTERGLPYFVMEYVKGEALTAYCDRHTLPIRARLELFIDVCDAVQHAHMKGIIHRDLKPTNILISVSDQGPLAKVIDFGVAKALAHTLTQKTIFTEEGRLIGTPEYMSPEQAEMGRTDIDTRTDVYALGVILYELLTGALPFDSQALREAAFDEIRRIIREVDPPKPSTRFAGLGDSSTEAARCRRTGRAELVSELRRELEWIPLMAMRKDRTERYRTPTDLADDIRNYLEGRPLKAGPESPTYRMRKFARRHRRAVLATALIALSLIGGLAGTTWGVFWALGERDLTRQALTREEEQRKLAERRQKETQQVADFQSKMLSEIDVEAMGRGIKETLRQQVQAALERAYVGEYSGRRKRTPDEVATELAAFDERASAAQAVDVARSVIDEFVLARAAHALTEQFPDQPEVGAAIHHAIGTAYEALGLYSRAELHLRATLEMRRAQYGDDHPDVGISIAHLGMLLWRTGNYATAESLLSEALGLLRKRLGNEHPDVATCMDYLATVLHDKGDYSAAEPLYREALALRRKLLGNEHLDVAGNLNNLARLLMDKEDFAASEPLFREALALHRKLLGDDHPDVAMILNNLATAVHDQGDYAGAEPLYRDALTLWRRLRGDEHPDVAFAMSNLGTLLWDKGDYAGADALLREALSIRRKMLGDDHPDVADSLNNLSGLYYARRDYASTELLLREALAIQRKLFGDENPQVAHTLNNLARVLHDGGNYIAAEPMFREALAINRKLLGDESPAVAANLNNLAGLLKDRGDYAAADSLFREALAIRRKLQGDDHPEVARSLNNIAGLLRIMGDNAAAEPLLREAMEIRQKRLPPGHADLAYTRAELGMVLLRLERFDEAERLLAAAVESLLSSTNAAGNRPLGALEGIVELYDTWHAAEPDKGYDAKATEWRRKLAEWQATTAAAEVPTPAPTSQVAEPAKVP